MTATVEPGRAEDWEDTGPIPLYTRPSGDTARWRDRGQIIATLIAERDEARAEVEHWKHHAWEAGEGFKRAIEDAVRAHARYRTLREAMEALADEWDRTYNAKPRTLGYASAYVAELRAALASVGRTEPAPESPAPFTRYSGTAGSKVDAALGGAPDEPPANIGATCCGKCPGDTCYVDAVTGA